MPSGTARPASEPSPYPAAAHPTIAAISRVPATAASALPGGVRFSGEGTPGPETGWCRCWGLGLEIGTKQSNWSKGRDSRAVPANPVPGGRANISKTVAARSGSFVAFGAS